MEKKHSMNIGPSPVKKKPCLLQSDERTLCIICLKGGGDILVSPKPQGLDRLYSCMRENNDDIFKFANDSGAVDESGFCVPIKYHRLCYQNYTRKSSYTLKQTSTVCTEPSTSTDLSAHDMATRSDTDPFEKNKCLICNSVKKHGDRKLTNVLTLSLQETIRTAAEKTCDTKLLVKLCDRDLVAIEAKYHKNCLAQLLTKAERVKHKGNSNVHELCDVFVKAFEMLLYDIEQDIENGKAYDMSTILNIYRSHLEKCGYEDAVNYRSEKLKKRLVKHFGQTIVFQSQASVNQSELIYSAKIDIKMTINKIAVLKKLSSEEAIAADLTIPQDDAPDLTLFHIALALRNSVRQCQGLSLNPCIDVKDICMQRTETMVPEDLYQFLGLLMYGKHESDVRCDPTMHKRVLATAQDIIYNASYARCKTPKHIGLAVSVQHLTRSRTLIDMLHSQGHCVSYDDVCRLDTACAVTVMKQITNEDVFLPSNIMPGIFAHTAADNIDINEETRDGKGTTHVLGSLIYQEHCPELAKYGNRISNEIRSRAVSDLKCLELTQCPNQFLKRGEMGHLLGRIDVTKWFSKENPSVSLEKAWTFARICPKKIFNLDFEPLNPNQQCIPSWGGFHAILKVNYDEKPTKTVIGYNPIVPGLPTDMSTMYTALKTLEKQMLSLGQEHPVVTLDLQLYIVAQEVRLRNWDEFRHYVFRLGGFHIMELYWKIMGKRYEESGIKDVLIEAGVFGPNAMETVMKGKNYKRCTLAHKIMFEAAARMKWEAFITWAVQNGKLAKVDADAVECHCEKLQNEMQNVFEGGQFNKDSQTKLKQLFQQIQYILERWDGAYNQFLATGKAESLAFQFWEQYIEDIQLALDYISAEKTANWTEHLRCVAEILCYAFAYDCHNYARWGPVYLAEMMLLPETSPEVQRFFDEGKHVVTRSEGTRFNSVWSDLGLEQPIVRDTKSRQGGIIGISRQQNATLKWYLTVHLRSAIMRNFKSICGFDAHQELIHHDLRPAETKKDERDIQSVMQIIKDRHGNPFSIGHAGDGTEPKPLVNMATGVVATTSIAESLLSAKKDGQNALEKYVQERLASHKEPVHNPIKKMKLPTFANIKQSRRKASTDKAVSLDSDRELFGRLLVLSKERNIDLKLFFQYELSNRPLAIANMDGSLAKTNKAQLLRDLENVTSSSIDEATFLSEVTPERKSETAVFVDYMACLHRLSSRPGIKTAGDLVDGLEHFIRSAFKEGDIVHVVADRYDVQESIKADERRRRGSTLKSPEVKIKSREQVLPINVNSFLSNPMNKDNFNDFAFNELMERKKHIICTNQTLVLSGGFSNHERVVCVTLDDVNDLFDIYSTQEEADSRLFLHVFDSVRRFKNNHVIIWSPDTDVLVLAIYLKEHFTGEMWFKTGIKANTRFISVNGICQHLGLALCQILLPFHALTGCDSTSCFKGRGKKTGWKILSAEPEKYRGLTEMGDSFHLPDEIKRIAMELVCRMYQQKSEVVDIDILRYKMFCKTQKQNEHLPTCTDSFNQHLKRVNYQCAVWKRALVARPDIPSPRDHGWNSDGDGLVPTLMNQAAAPDELVDFTTCKCVKSMCSSNHCKCLKLGLSCSLACLCEASEETCNNQTLLNTDSDALTDDDDED